MTYEYDRAVSMDSELLLRAVWIEEGIFRTDRVNCNAGYVKRCCTGKFSSEQ